MGPPVNGHLSPLISTTAEVAPNTPDILQPWARRRRPVRRAPRSESPYRDRRIDIRHHPYLMSGVSDRCKKLDIIPQQNIAIDLRLNIDDMQAASILMLFAERMLTYKEPESPSAWLERRKRPRQRLLHILRSWCSSDARFELSPEQRGWRGVDVRWLARSAPRPAVPAAPVMRAQHHAPAMAERLVALARRHLMPDEDDICCPHCGMLPVVPVTGPCGHTRCLECVKRHDQCSCGKPNSEELHVDTCVQYLIGKLLGDTKTSEVASRTSDRPPDDGHLRYGVVRTLHTIFVQEDCQALPRRSTVAQRLSRGLGVSLTISPDSFTAPDVPARLPMTTQTRLLHACQLIGRQYYAEAAAHLARAAATSESEFARLLLVQMISILLEDRDPESVARDLGAAVAAQGAGAWLAASDLECVLCRDTLAAPVTTPCGHTYCRRCIEGSLDYRRACPLCLRDLSHFNLFLTQQSRFVCAALASLNLSQSPPLLDPNVIPVFACVTAFPKMSCPLLITLPHYRVLIRRMLQSGSRRLGMTALNQDHSYPDYGTMLEIRDCVESDDGRMFLSTIGMSRFKIVEKVGDCFARVERLTDEPPSDPAALAERLLGSEVGALAAHWVDGLRRPVLRHMRQTYGKPPEHGGEWWRSADGPDWLWWLAVNLPLSQKLKDMMISNCSLLTRLWLILRSLRQAIWTHTHSP